MIDPKACFPHARSASRSYLHGFFATALAAFLSVAASTAARAQGPTLDAIESRRQIAERKTHLFDAGPVGPKATPAELAAALDLPAGLLSSAVQTGPAAGQAVVSGLGVIAPRGGSSFLVLSSGRVQTIAEPGTDFSPTGTSGDRSAVRMVLNVPSGSSRLSFDFNFLSAEYPEFVGSIFNDTFTAVLTDASGSRTIASASVNSSFFFSGSSSLAGGTGFDLFTSDPDGVDSSFGGGLPDAGLTNFLAVDVPFTSNGQITLELAISDLGDGILDSAVIVDNFRLSAFELLDANDSRFAPSGFLTAEPASLASGGKNRRGVAADGVSRLLLRSSHPAAGTTEFCLENGSSPLDGFLSLPGSTTEGTCVMATVVQAGGGFRAFAYYRAPEDFNRGSDDSLASRSLNLRATYRRTNGTTTVTRVPLEIVRPPVVLVHGLWSEPATWTFDLVGDPRFLVVKADYSSTAGSRFGTNSQVVRFWVGQAIEALRTRNFAATQVDVVGHSMGGLLARIWTTDSQYRGADSFHAGGINKLITLDTPHTGSPLGDVMVGARDAPLIGSVIASLFRSRDMPLDQGGVPSALDDLSKQSPALAAVGRARVPSHTLVGVGGNELFGNASDTLSDLPGKWGKAFAILEFFFGVLDIFEETQHDAVVGRQSQEGGTQGFAQSIRDGLDSIHIRNTGSDDYSVRVIQLLNSEIDGGPFMELPRPSGLSSFDLPSPAVGQIATRALTARSVQSGLTVQTLAPGTAVAPGQQVPVTVQVAPGRVVQRVLVVGGGEAQIDTAPPFQLNLTIPVEAVGPITISATGKNSAGDFFTSNEVTLRVVPTASLQSLELDPPEGFISGVGGTLQLAVTGHYADSVARNLTRSVTGTTYASDSPGIATVSAEGLVRGVGAGTTTIVARNGSDEDSITVRVAGLEPLGSCAGSGEALCLNGGRFRASAAFRTAQGATGLAHAVRLTGDTGYFWFFGASNVEMIVKLVNGCGLNQRFWVFAGGLTDVEVDLTVEDVVTGSRKVYRNPLGQAFQPLQDTSAFATCNASLTDVPLAEEALAEELLGERMLPLDNGRFRVDVSYRTSAGQTGTGTAVPLSDDTGYFWFFSPANVEMVIKVINGCGLNNRFWVFAAGLTDVRVDITVEDTRTGRRKTYRNDLGTPFRPIQDTAAFSTCP